MKDKRMITAEALNDACAKGLPGALGIHVVAVDESEIRLEMVVRSSHMAPNGFLHAGAIVTLADTACGNGCISHLPEGGKGFTTIELKSNHLGTARDGTLTCVARPAHRGGERPRSGMRP